MKKKVLVIAAHPDDEVLGAGGSIAKHAQAGDEVHVLIMATGLTSRGVEHTHNLEELNQAMKKAHQILGVKGTELAHFPDNAMDELTLLQIVKRVEESISKIKPQIVYTHHAGDLNIDHRLTHQAVITSCRGLPGTSVETLLFFEVPSSTEWMPRGSGEPFSPQWFVDISENLKTKMEALKAYASEMRPYPHARSYEAVESLAKWRGASSGLLAAESFMLGRRIQK